MYTAQPIASSRQHGRAAPKASVLSREAPLLDRPCQRALFSIFVEAASALIAQLVEVGIRDGGDIARRLNRRGFPCWGRSRWTAGAVAMVMRQKARLDERA